MATDLDVFKSLWKSINDIFVLPPLPGSPATTTFLMETPGLTIDPDSYDPEKFTDSGSMTSPGYATARLCDRIPALSRHFYNTGGRVSSYWTILMHQYGISAEESAAEKELKKSYDEAVVALYGSQDGYIKQQKTEQFLRLDVLHDDWEKKKRELDAFEKSQENLPDDFFKQVDTKTAAADEAFAAYDSLRTKIKKYEDDMLAYATSGVETLMFEQKNKLSRYKMTDAGKTDEMFYQTRMQPPDWYTWFRSAKDTDLGMELDDTDEWIEVKIEQCKHDEISEEDKVMYRSLLYYMDNANSSLTKKGSELKISFKVRKVSIERPWLDLDVLKHPNLGIKTFEKRKWSTGSLVAGENSGVFPLLPTACIVAKNVKVSSVAFSAQFEERLQCDESAAMEIGPFAVGGSQSNFLGCTKTRNHYNKDSKTLEVEGAQIIGWICTVVPEFPKASV